MIYYVKFRLLSLPRSAFFQARGLQTTTHGQTQPISCLFMACEIRMTFPFINGCFRLLHKHLHSILDLPTKPKMLSIQPLRKTLADLCTHFYPGQQMSRKKDPVLLSGLSVNKRDGKVRKKKNSLPKRSNGNLQYLGFFKYIRLFTGTHDNFAWTLQNDIVIFTVIIVFHLIKP